MSSALDRLLGQTLESMIREKLGQKTCEKIEVRLRQRYNLDLAASINDFYTLDATLREFFSSGADAIEEDFANRLTALKREIVLCSICHNVSEHDPCDVCSDPGRDASVLCVVEQP